MANPTMKSLSTRIDELESHIVALTVHIQTLQSTASAPTAKIAGERDYGPDSEHKLDDRMALRIILGRYRTWSVRKIADDLGFSRGQIYSLRGRYTFKATWKIADAITAHRLAK